VVRESILGLMAASILESSRIICSTDMANIIGEIMKLTRVNGKRTKNMELEFI